jgi:hypothetical protein
LESSLVRIAQLEDLQKLSEVIATLLQGESPAASKKKTVSAVTQPASSEVGGNRPSVVNGPLATKEVVAASEPTSSCGVSDVNSTERDATEIADPLQGSDEEASLEESCSQSQDPEALWRATIGHLEGMAADCAADFISAANFAPNRVVVTFPTRYNSSKSFCQKPDRHGEMEKIISDVAGRKLKLEFALREDEAQPAPPSPTVSPQKRLRDAMQDPFVQQAMELFSADVTGVDGKKQIG